MRALKKKRMAFDPVNIDRKRFYLR